jgi:hypothetical protein
MMQEYLDDADLERAIAWPCGFCRESRERHWYRVSLQLSFSRAGVVRPDLIGVNRALRTSSVESAIRGMFVGRKAGMIVSELLD